MEELFGRIKDRWNGMVGAEENDPEQEQSLLERFTEATTLTRTQRLTGFAVCVLLGALLTLVAPTFILRPSKFAVVYSLGNLLSLGSTMFFVGPSKQLSNMFANRDRSIAASVFLLSMFLTLYVALHLHSALLAIPCIVIQTLALFWYILGYIPWAQGMVLRMLGRAGESDEVSILL
jgi:hypothetical protein